MKPDWIAVDWGTSNLHIWVMDANDQVLGEKCSYQGMNNLAPHEFEGVILSHIEPWLGKDVILVLACGMVGARQGWYEAEYDTVPTRPATKMVHVEATDPRISVHIVSGVSQLEPADVMRGEETQIAGFLSRNPDYEGSICLPGTHSKWVQIKDGKIINFQTALTGELFALLSNQSVLRHSLGVWSDECFKKSTQAVFAAPNQWAVHLFAIRAMNLLKEDGHGISRLSATLIASELVATRHYWQEQKVTIIGAGGLSKLYGMALSNQGVQPEVIKADALTLAALKKARSALSNA